MSQHSHSHLYRVARAAAIGMLAGIGSFLSQQANASDPLPYSAAPSMGFTGPSGVQHVKAGQNFNYVLIQTDQDTFAYAGTSPLQTTLVSDPAMTISATSVNSSPGFTLIANGIDSSGKENWTIAGQAVITKGLYTDSFLATDPNTTQVLVDSNVAASVAVQVS